jgi:hypothetical protein
VRGTIDPRHRLKSDSFPKPALSADVLLRFTPENLEAFLRGRGLCRSRFHRESCRFRGASFQIIRLMFIRRKRPVRAALLRCAAGRNDQRGDLSSGEFSPQPDADGTSSPACASTSGELCASSGALSQNTYFSANCMILGSSAVLIFPNVLLLRFVVGAPSRVWLGRLNASARNSSVCLSRARNTRDKLAST